MKLCSQEYLDSINNPVRNPFYIKVMLGLSNIDAQTNAKMTGEGSNISSPEIFGSTPVNYPYASFESDFSTADGNLYFPFESGYEKKYNGFISNEISDEEGTIDTTLSFSFPKAILPLELKGLTLEFGPVYPLEFALEWNGESKTYTNSSSKFETADVFSNVESLTLNVTKMSSPYTRFHLTNLVFGIALVFSGDDIIESNFKHYTNPISNTLPSMEFSFSIINRDYEYDLENPSSTLNFLEESQECQVSFGYELPSGQIEWFKTGTTLLKDWSSEQYKATFKCADLLSFYNADYIKGVYHEEGISLYDLFADVAGDMGLTENDYVVDDYFKNIYTHNPIPICSHAEALQMIANAGRGYLTYDVNGRIAMHPNFIPQMYFSSDSATNYSDLTLLKSGSDKHYATFANSESDGNSFFIPEDESYSGVAFASSEVSSETGVFTNPPVITFELESPYMTMGILIEFGNTISKHFKIETYLNDSAIDVFEVENEDKTVDCSRKWNTFDKCVVTFFDTEFPYQRLYVNRVSFGDLSDYHISFNDYIDETPKGSDSSKIKTLYVTCTRFTKNGEDLNIEDDGNGHVTIFGEVSNDEEISSIDYDAESSGLEEIITFDEPCYNIYLTGAELLECGSYYVKFRYNTVTSESTVKVYGRKFNISYVNISKQIGNKGAEEYYSNDLVDSITQARLLADFVASYIKESRDYEFEWRGDPRIESNDIVYIENRYNPKMPFRIMTNEIAYNQGAFNGKVKGKKTNVG